MAGNGWIEYTVDDIKGKGKSALATGPFGSAISSKFFQDSGIPVIRGSNLSQDVGHRLVEDGLAFVSEIKAKESSRSVARRGDLVFTCWGTIDQVGLIDDRCSYPEYIVSNKQMKLTPDPAIADSLFLYYVFSSPEMRATILNYGIGSSVPGFNLGQLRSIPFLLPPLLEQKAIARILGTLDDKIELNRRMNETLEATARAIFKSWFVDFDPVRAKMDGQNPPGMDEETSVLFPDACQESELGLIPAGWKAGTLGEVAANKREGVRPEEIEPDTAYVGLEHLPRRCITLSEWGQAAEVTSNKSTFSESDILFGKLRRYFHKVGVAPTDGVCSTDILVVVPKTDVWFTFALFHFSSDELIAYSDACSTGTKMPRTNWKTLAQYEAVLPTASLADRFNRIVVPMIRQTQLNAHEWRALARLRDTLLPKLLSGELRVADAERISRRHT